MLRPAIRQDCQAALATRSLPGVRMSRESAVPTITPPPAPAGHDLVLRRTESLAEYEECVAIQDETWGAGFSERVPASILLVAQKIGGVVVGAFDPDGYMLGFVFGLTGVEHGALVHWSHMLAVRPAARGGGVGEQLKRHQRDLVRAVGVSTMRWTFDPLVARNAHLNLVRLGARVAAYVPNMYGSDTGSPLHGPGDTDRLVAAWDLAGDAGLLDRVPADAPPDPGAPVVNAPGADGAPALAALTDHRTVRIAVPRDLQRVPPERLAAWRATTRAAFLAYLGRGYVVSGFQRGTGEELAYYELAAPALARPGRASEAA